MSCNSEPVNYVFNNDFVFNNYRELCDMLKELKEQDLVRYDMSLTEFSEECFNLGQATCWYQRSSCQQLHSFIKSKQ